MIIKRMKKFLTALVMIASLLAYAAPMGLCVSGSPTIDTQIDKPVLRGAIKPSALKLEGDISITKGNPKISLSLRDSDAAQVLRMFADKAGLNIIFHDSVTGEGSTVGKVTLDLVNVPLNDAFKMVMQVTGLTYYVDNNTMIVATAEKAKSLNLSKQELMTIPIKYIDAAALADFMNTNIFSINKPGLSNANIAITNPSSNEILIFGTKNDYIMAKKVVEQFDKKPLEETFIVNHTTPKEMADLLCNVLFKDNAGSSTSTSGSAATTSSDTSLTLGAGVVACRYSSKTAAKELSSLSASNLSVTYYAQRGAISVAGGSAQQIELAKDFIAKNDKKQPQAYLEISIIELSESGSREFNNTWQVWSKYFSGTFDGSSTKTNPLYPNFLSEGQGYTVVDSAENKFAKLYDVATFSGAPTITYAINYIISNNKGRVLANPKIMITNGETSTIDLSSDYVQKVTSQVLATSGIAGAIQRTYEIGSDEGIKVSMIPFISPDGYVTLNIKPTYSTIKEKVYAPSSAGSTDLVATLLQRRNLELKNVRIKDGETLVVGGMIRENETKSVSKIPVLGDLPGIGAFFRNSATTKEKQELVIMITPKIIKDTEDVVKNSDVTL